MLFLFNITDIMSNIALLIFRICFFLSLFAESQQFRNIIKYLFLCIVHKASFYFIFSKDASHGCVRRDILFYECILLLK